MTNGEKVMETFPGGETKRGYYGTNSLPLVVVTFGTTPEAYEMAFLESWWDAEYIAPPIEVKTDENGFSDYAEFDGA